MNSLSFLRKHVSCCTFPLYEEPRPLFNRTDAISRNFNYLLSGNCLRQGKHHRTRIVFKNTAAVLPCNSKYSFSIQKSLVF